MKCCRANAVAGETINDSIAAILTKEPPPLADYLANVPSELQRIVRKILEKKRDKRYQTARDLMTDIKTLRREIDLRGEIQRSNSLPSNGANNYDRRKRADAQHRRRLPTSDANQRISENNNSSLDAENEYPAKGFGIFARDTGDNIKAASTVITPGKKTNRQTGIFLISAIFSLVLLGYCFYNLLSIFQQYSETGPPLRLLTK